MVEYRSPSPALNGVRVLEASNMIAAQMCGRLFAANGAEVLHSSEAPRNALETWLAQYKTRAEAAPDASSFDLIIADSSSADSMRRAVGAKRIPVIEIAWFDARGPYASHLINDALMQALIGVAYGFGLPEGPPILPQGHAPQIVSGLCAYIAGVSALLLPPEKRPRRIDTSVYEAALCFAEPGAAGGSLLGGPPRRLGVNRFAPTYPCSIYRAADDWVGLTALTPAQWRALCELIGRPELGREPRFSMTLQRLAAADEIDALLKPLFAQKPASHWIEEGIARRIPITPVPRPGGAPKLAHWRERGAFSPIAEGSAIEGPNLPYAMSFDTVKREHVGGDKPLSGVRVVDFSMGWAGPLAARYFADLGADVAKIESRERYDWWRSWEGNASEDPTLLERARNFLDVNRGKRAALIDLTTAEGLAQAKALIARADIVIENLGPGVMTRLGLGPADLHAIKPGVISISMGAFGSRGPLSGVRAYGSTVEQASGMPFVNGREDWPPCLQHVAYGDPVAGLFAAAAGLTALAARGKLGGATIDLSQVECLFQLGADAIVTEQETGAPSPRRGSRRASAAPCCVVAADGVEEWLAVVVETDAQWRALCGVLQRSDLARDGDDVEAAITAWAREQDARSGAELLQAAGVPAEQVRPASRLIGCEQLAAANFWVTMDRAVVGPHETGAPPFAFDGVRPIRMLPAPTMGQHTAQILAELNPS